MEQNNEPINAANRMTISSDGLRAELIISAPQNGGSPPTEEKIRASLEIQGVTYGVDEEMIGRIVENPQYDFPYIMARGLEPIDGTPSILEYKIQLGKDIKPKENPDGSVDYKDLGLIQNVKENQVLCVKTPAGEGTPGYNVLGVLLKPRPGRDDPLPMGKNTKLTEDQLQLMAACDGEVDLVGNKLHVLNTYTVNGDVSNATGNINFVGNLLIYGNVLTGFSIQADGNITVNGSVEDANVSAGGNIVIKEGIHGGGQDSSQGVVQAGGFVKSKYIQSAIVRAGGDIESTYIQHSNVQSMTNVTAMGTKGTLTGGRVVARNNITAAFIGGRNSAVPTTLEVGNNPATVEKYHRLEKELETIESQMSSLKPAIAMLEGLEQEGKLSEERLDTLNQARTAYQTLGDNMAVQQKELEAVKEEMASLGYGSINAKQSIFPGVRVVIGSEQILLERQYDFTSFVRGGDGISSVPYQA
ncbi:MAG: FapA family protein [Clostridiales bacterium]|nr:FapA family protein [Clostridiales bacterium]